MDFGNLKDYQKPIALATKMQLDDLINKGYLDIKNLEGRVLDWGACYGTRTQSLKTYGGDVEAVDMSYVVFDIAEDGILPLEKVHHEDGIDFIKNKKGEFNLIIATMAYPSDKITYRYFVTNLYRTAIENVAENGQVLITSDALVFREAINDLQEIKSGVVLDSSEFPLAFIGKR